MLCNRTISRIVRSCFVYLYLCPSDLSTRGFPSVPRGRKRPTAHHQQAVATRQFWAAVGVNVGFYVTQLRLHFPMHLRGLKIVWTLRLEASHRKAGYNKISSGASYIVTPRMIYEHVLQAKNNEKSCSCQLGRLFAKPRPALPATFECSLLVCPTKIQDGLSHLALCLRPLDSGSSGSASMPAVCPASYWG